MSRLNLEKESLGLFLYNWDYLGYNTNTTNSTECEPQINVMDKKSPCGFDTHYPEFLPARSGFDESLKSIQ